MAKVLVEYQDIFATHKYDLGLTNLVKHNIDTGDHPPIKQNPRRLPLVQTEEARAQLKELLEQGLIKPISSPWASPIVLVRKKDSSFKTLC